MAEGKKSFVAYSDWKEVFESIPDEQAGKLIKHIFAYVNDEDPKTEDIIVKALFVQIRSTLKRDLQKWEKQKEQRSLAGKKSAETRAKSNENQQPLTTVNEHPTKSNENQLLDVRCNMLDVSDSVSVSESVSEKEFIQFVSAENKFSSTKKNQKTFDERKEAFREKIDPFREKYDREMLNEFWRYWTEKNENGKKMRFEMQKVFDVGRRLATWFKNDNNKFNNGKTDKRGHRHEPSKQIDSYGQL